MTLQILLIDDHALVANALKVVLEREGHQVVVAAGGSDGVRAFHEAANDGRLFDVVLTDFSMSDFDGLHVARAVKAVSATTRVVLLTAYRFSPDDPLPEHVDAVVSKPPDVATLRAALEPTTSE